MCMQWSIALCIENSYVVMCVSDRHTGTIIENGIEEGLSTLMLLTWEPPT